MFAKQISQLVFMCTLHVKCLRQKLTPEFLHLWKWFSYEKSALTEITLPGAPPRMSCFMQESQ